MISVLLVTPLRWFAPATSMFMIAEWFAQFFHPTRAQAVSYQWIERSEISDKLSLAILAGEDQRFAQHWGIDFSAITKVIQEDHHRKPLRGASTITQQVAKNLFLWSGRSYLRKVLEAYFALLLETFLNKRRILEIYVNTVEFGPGIYGAKAASHIFFNKLPYQLNRYESSLLASALPNPRIYQVGKPSKHMQAKRAWIEKQMNQLGGVKFLETIL